MKINIQNYYSGKSFTVASKHEKEKQIVTLFKNTLGLKFIPIIDLDTDVLGTFSGEIERTLYPIDACRKKCEMAREICSTDIVIATEGSFGAHPTIGFVPCNDEIIMFKDFVNNIEIKAREISTNTNFSSKVLNSLKDLYDFTKATKFPSHALILKENQNASDGIIVKGIQDEAFLKETFTAIFQKQGFVYGETDMRAHLNPSRMEVIKSLSNKLMDKILKQCPSCLIPGFDVDEVISGLPCENCGLPTNSTLKFLYRCQKCQFEEEILFPHNKTHENPMYCNFCNP